MHGTSDDTVYRMLHSTYNKHNFGIGVKVLTPIYPDWNRNAEIYRNRNSSRLVLQNDSESLQNITGLETGRPWVWGVAGN